MTKPPGALWALVVVTWCFAVFRKSSYTPCQSGLFCLGTHAVGVSYSPFLSNGLDSLEGVGLEGQGRVFALGGD